ncbi:prepilin-type N-terminal cleavage/methylation domain-containing protein [Candidatus Kaiserbacteria bacterium]|nr:prepilin-type N-terminal cleavage/methylation domain-containing protein [Candidatus Kaiserbacteria bacterium]MCB9812165.1 prepilin-type N-terminal cleavage/methylation domain-containing protein [Candidatus Nomurabacteria bacterium]
MHHPTPESGFSLVETLVAITLLLIVITGPMVVSTSTARSTSFASEQVVAFFLAQEGVEMVQRARDDLYLQAFSTKFDSVLDNELNNTDQWNLFADRNGTYRNCYVATNSDGCGLGLNTDPDGSLKAPIDCGTNSSSCRLYYDEDGERSRYTHTASGNEETPYTRVIKLEDDPARPDEIKVTSRVTWRTGSRRDVQESVVETYLFNAWYE